MVRTKIPAAINRTSENATCDTTSSLRNQPLDRSPIEAPESVFNIPARLTSRGMDGGRQSKRDTCDQRQSKDEEDGNGIHAQVQDCRDMALGHKVDEGASHPIADDDRKRSGEERQQQAFGEHLAYQAKTAGTDRRPHSQLARPRRCPGQEHVGDIRAGDQQHESHQHEQNVERRVQLTENAAVALPYRNQLDVLNALCP